MKSKKLSTKRHRRHGLRWHVNYRSWNAMMDRCNNPKNDNYKNYGGRGIKVCKRWHKVENFVSDMGVRPKNTSLDRINVNGNYTKSNCRWADHRTQCNNTRRNVIVGGSGLTLAQLARKMGCSASAIKGRRRKGWTDQEILETPIRGENVRDSEGRFLRVRKKET